MRIVDLSRRPFLNERPVRRTAVFLWVLGALLLAANLWLFGSYLRSSAQLRSRLAEIGSRLDEEGEQIAALRSRAGGVSIAALNERTRFLNRQIDERAFPWSALFEDLEQVLPLDVWLLRVQPEVEDPSRTAEVSERRRTTTVRRTTSRRDRRDERIPELVRPEPRREQVQLSLQGVSRSDDAMLEFVDRLFDDPSFGRPLLARESLDDRTRLVRFSLDVDYSTGAFGRDPDATPGEALAESTPDAVPEISTPGAGDAATATAAPEARADAAAAPEAQADAAEAPPASPGASAPSAVARGESAGRPSEATATVEDRTDTRSSEVVPAPAAPAAPGAAPRAADPGIRSQPSRPGAPAGTVGTLPVTPRAGTATGADTPPATPPAEPTGSGVPTTGRPPSPRGDDPDAGRGSTDRPDPVPPTRDASSTARLASPPGFAERLFSAEEVG